MFSGSMVALVTPMTPNGQVDSAAVERLVDWHLASGTRALVLTGSTGEGFSLTLDERKQLWRSVVRQVAGRIPVIAGTGHPSTQTTLEASQAAQQCGIDGCLVVTPPYVKPTQEGLFLHFQELAQQVAIPFILYTVPGRAGVDMLPETVAKLSKLPNIVGIKEATGDLKRLKKILELTDNTFPVFSGDDATAMEWMWQGAAGVISVTANVDPHRMFQMCEAAMADDKTLSDALNQKMSALHELLFVESNPIPTKWVLSRIGLIHNVLRLPLTPLASAYHGAVQQAMLQAGIRDKSAISMANG